MICEVCQQGLAHVSIDLERVVGNRIVAVSSKVFNFDSAHLVRIIEYGEDRIRCGGIELGINHNHLLVLTLPEVCPMFDTSNQLAFHLLAGHADCGAVAPPEAPPFVLHVRKTVPGVEAFDAVQLEIPGFVT